MLARYVQKGDAIDYRPAEAVAAGDVVIIADLIGIARLDIEANTLPLYFFRRFPDCYLDFHLH